MRPCINDILNPAAAYEDYGRRVQGKSTVFSFPLIPKTNNGFFALGSF
jgi:hypothetical protein